MMRIGATTQSLNVYLLLVVATGGCVPDLDHLNNVDEPPFMADEPGLAGSAGRASTPSSGGVAGGGTSGGVGGITSGGGSGGGSTDVGSGGNAGGSGGAALVGSSGMPSADGGAGCIPSGGEACDGADNDCNDVIDDGCPQGVSTVFESDLPVSGDSSGGSAFGEDCAGGEILIGARFAMGPFLTQAQGICGKIELSLRTDGGYDVTTSEGSMLAAHPETTQDVQTSLSCRAGEAVVGLGISQQNAQSDTGTFIVIPEVWLSCAKLSLVQTDSDYYLDWQDAYDLDSLFGTMSDDSAWYEYSEVPAGQVATRFKGASGAWIDRMGFGVSSTLVTLVR
ncbi:MAG TPA: hypothetical protein VEQ59_08445 [Polyangiaceae bacterium]|nr:hypothetical protein [Polyangiaceae bacterium]